MNSKRSRVRIGMVVAALALGPITVACGGDDDSNGGGSGEALSDEAFCARFAELDDEFAQLSDEEAATRIPQELNALAAQAPNPELANALSALGEAFGQFAEIDQDDIASLEQLDALFGDPEFIAQNDVIDDYLAETCDLD